MKNLSFFDKIIFLLNGLLALALALAVPVHYLPIDWVPSLSVLSLVVPFLVLINLLFILYWALRRKLNFWLSSVVLLLCLFFLGTFYRFSGGLQGEQQAEDVENTLTLMSFNARGFNEMGQMEIDHVDSLIYDFVSEKDPDIVCFQESFYALKGNKALPQYPYKFVDFVYGKPSGKVIQSIYSKYPILKVDSIIFPKSANTAIYADIRFGEDTLRLYNVHLQSFRIAPNLNTIKNAESSRLYARSKKVMLKQFEQARLVRASMDASPHKNLVVGDFNNTQYSNVYRTLKGDMQDTYKEKGKGFGRTFELMEFPIRIDYILADPEFEVLEHRNFNVQLSDHYPIMARLRLGPHQ